MKITNATKQMGSGVMGSHAVDEKKVAGIGRPSFHEHINKEEGKLYEERIAELLAKIGEQGDKLSKKVDIKELKIYKKLISEFLDETVNNSHKFSKESFLDRRGRYKVYAIIKKINENVDALTDEVLKKEKDNLKILQRIEDIRGLLLDIVL